MALVAATASGCVLPTTLEQEQTINYRPVIVSASPGFGTLTRTANDADTIDFFVEDANAEDVTIYARLYTGSGTTRIYTFLSTTARYPDGVDPTQVTDPEHPPHLVGNFFGTAGAKLCGLGYAGDLYLVVADRPFANDVTEDTVPGLNGLTNENHWTLVCQ